MDQALFVDSQNDPALRSSGREFEPGIDNNRMTTVEGDP
jgi:hypothetical protein